MRNRYPPRRKGKTWHNAFKEGNKRTIRQGCLGAGESAVRRKLPYGKKRYRIGRHREPEETPA